MPCSTTMAIRIIATSIESSATSQACRPQSLFTIWSRSTQQAICPPIHPIIIPKSCRKRKNITIKSSFKSTEHTFKSSERPFKSTERAFKDFERKNHRALFSFSLRRKKNGIAAAPQHHRPQCDVSTPYYLYINGSLSAPSLRHSAGSGGNRCLSAGR